MEASETTAAQPTAPTDPFQQGIEIGDDDPFATADSDFTFADDPPQAEVPIDTSDLPVVDKEGNEVPAPVFDPVSQTLDTPVPAPEPTPVAPAPDPTPPVESAGPTEVPIDTAVEPPAAPAVVAQEPPQPVAAPPAAVPDPPQAETPAEEPAPEPVPAADSSPEEDDSEPPAEKKDSKGRTTHRRYRVLLTVGAHKFEDAVWWEKKDGTVVEKGTTGAKRQSYVLGRDQDHAQKMAFVALGAPAAGIRMVVVADSNFQSKFVELAPPEPQRMRLKVS